jgi:hypothetical protein
MKRFIVASVAAAVVVPVVVVAVGVAGAETGGPAAWQGVHGKKARIANALSAAPAAVSAGARVLDYGAKATDPYVLLRKGDDAWTCFPDWPASPGDDPICYDRSGMRWLDAYNAGKKPHLTTPGIAYRLKGGSDPSLTDPAALEPAKGEHWIAHPPHIVVIPAGKLDEATYGKDAYGGGAWVMWPGTPYAHLHLPVGDSGGMAGMGHTH